MPEVEIWLLKAIEFAKQTGQRTHQANLHWGVGDVQAFRDDRDAALASYSEALTLFKAVGSSLGQANTLAAQSRLYLIQNDQEKSDDLLGQAIILYETIRSPYSIAAQLGNHGYALLGVDRKEDAKPYFLRAAEVFDQIGMTDFAEQCRRETEE